MLVFPATADTIAGFEAEIGRLTEELTRTEEAGKETAAAETRLHAALDAQMQQRERVEGERARVDPRSAKQKRRNSEPRA